MASRHACPAPVSRLGPMYEDMPLQTKKATESRCASVWQRHDDGPVVSQHQGPPMNMSPRKLVDAAQPETFPRALRERDSTVLCRLEYEPGPTCAAYSSSIDFLKR